jgi:hypothetical protein
MVVTISISVVICPVLQLATLTYAGVLEIRMMESSLTINDVYLSI